MSITESVNSLYQTLNHVHDLINDFHFLKITSNLELLTRPIIMIAFPGALFYHNLNY